MSTRPSAAHELRAEPGTDVREVVVLGAFGRTGWRLVRQARERGWRVIAADERPDTAQGYRRLDARFVDEIAGSGAAVLSALGPRRGESGAGIGDLLARLLAADGEQRIVWVLGAAVPRPGDRRGPFYSWMARTLAARDDPAWREKTRELALLEHSTARWTAVRPPRLRDDVDPGRYDDVDPALRLFSSIGRSTLAAFMLDCVEFDRHVREAPLVVGR